MTPEEMRQSSNRKFAQVIELMKLLQVGFQAKEKVNQDGFIEKVVVFVDDEKYPIKEEPLKEDQPQK